VDAYQHFTLGKPPFDPVPDPAFYHDAPNHAEVLATLQYVVLSRKRCCVVIGESGLGKTLVAKMVAQIANQTAPVFWIHGGAQSDNDTKVRIYPPRCFNRNDLQSGIEDTSLTGEIHVPRFFPDPPLLIVDAADELPEHGWREVAAWLSNEVRYPKPPNVLLFGLPALLDTLARPEMECIRQRIFRACRLEPLSSADAMRYIGARLARAGGALEDIFTGDALVKIVDAARGYPNQINKLCDNAMLEAYSEERTFVTEDDVNKALRTLFSARLFEQNHAPAPAADLTPPPVELPPRNQPETSFTELLRPCRFDESSSPAVESDDEFDDEIRDETPPAVDVLGDRRLADSLTRFKSRLNDALELVREARAEDEAPTDEIHRNLPLEMPRLASLIVSWRKQSAELREENEALYATIDNEALAESA
jgi:general secretion pathway protein A